MPPSSLPARVARLLFAVGLSAGSPFPAAALEVEVTRGPLRDTGSVVGLARLTLTGPDPFGGLSGLLWPTPDRVLFVSDRGRLFAATLRRDEAGAAVDLVDWAAHDVPFPGGRSDLEALAVSEGQLLATVEYRPHVMRFRGPLEAPEEMVSYFTRDSLGFPMNSGFEALVDLPGDGWLAVAEHLGEDGTHVAYTRDRRRLGYRAAEEFAPTGADRVGDRLLFVERRVSLLAGWQARITCVPVAAVAAGVVLEPTVVARLGFADGIDNMEGIAVRPDGDDLELLLVSDDNQSSFQRTVLLHYRWPGAASGGCGP